MESSGGGEETNQTTYPFYSSYNPSLFPISADGGSRNSQSEPLTVLAESSTSAPSSIPCHSFKEAKDALGSRVNNMSRKEKRKMIKNKRKRLQRQELSQREQEQKRVRMEEGMSDEDEKHVDEEETKLHALQECQWIERNRMIEEDRRSRELAEKLTWEKKKKEREEKEYLKNIAKQVAERTNSSLTTTASSEKTPAHSQTQVKKPEVEYCLSYLRTGCCRFGQSCKHHHVIPKRSRGILIHNMYSSPRTCNADDDYLSSYLEYTDEEVQANYTEFFYDLISELQKIGKLLFVRVSCNDAPHLRGNVYAVWETREEGLRALQTFQGRFYAGNELQVEYLPESVIDWTNGLCNDFVRGRCSRGRECSFLHFYRNPENLYDKEVVGGGDESKASSSRWRSHSKRLSVCSRIQHNTA